MRIGVDAVPLQKLHGGVNYYIFFLLNELIQIRPEDTFFLFTNQDCPESDIHHFKQYKNVHICPFFPSFLGHSIWAQTSLSYACWSKNIDVFWGTTQTIPLLKKTPTKTVLTLYDFVYLLCPETMSIYKKIYLKLFSRIMLKKADAILPISKGTGSKLKQFYGLDYREIIYPPLKPQVVFTETTSLSLFGLTSKNYLITIGTLEPRKNLNELLEIYLTILKQCSPETVLPLVIIGGGGWKNKQLLELLTKVKEIYPNHFHLMGYRKDSEIASLLSGARYHVMVSKYEGYGMPIAESRMCHTPVICLDQPEMREAAENDGIFLSSQTWKEEIKPYLLSNSEVKSPILPKYSSNREKAMKISAIIDSVHKPLNNLC